MTDALTLEILKTPKVYAEFSGELNDALNFGFSYVESEDHMVSFVLVSPEMALRILREIPETTLDPDQEILGKLWTADLLCSRKVKEDRIMFANEPLSTALTLQLKPEAAEQK